MVVYKGFKTRKYLFVILTFLLLILVNIIVFSNVGSNNFSYFDNGFWIKLYGTLGWISLFWSILTWKLLRNELLSIYTIFLIVLYLFSFGHSLMLVLGLVSEPDWLLSQITINQLIGAQSFTLLCLISFHLGALIICKPSVNNTYIKNNLYPNTNITEETERINKSIKYVAIILLILSLPSFIYNTVITTITVMKHGYMALYGYDDYVENSVGLLGKIFSFTSQFFVPALICLLVAFREDVRKRKLIFLLMVVYIIDTLYIGGRNDAVTLVLVIICIYHYSIKPIKLKGAFKIAVFGYLFVSFLTIVARLRSIVDKSISDYLVLFIDSFFRENLFIVTIIELGGSMFPLAKVMQIFPSNVEFWEGKSYVYAVISVVPNLGFWDIHPATKYADGPHWLMDYLNMSYGPGFSLFADAFRNFGWIGFFVFIIFGFIFGKIYSSIDKNTILIRPDIFCLVMIFAEATIMSVRGDNLYIIRPLFYIVIPIYILIRIINNHFINKQKSANQ
ncbi:O-antigen polysaccharide polymerase Wzy [Cytobacillus firmus]|uniref:O-antigen polysaccharide polymerase Wzy n=1 Tax=Cytobacillus firmus TaxID=1399 RepID=UPI0024C1D359|nr:O-antigen polysaccharide polymerase Wzy [Cytobacillus firmus]WHY33852.1 O-antigen polysaccharide polymerase Wzy [Cytobacillus firmus]